MIDWSSVLQTVLEYVLPLIAVAAAGYVIAIGKALADYAIVWLDARIGTEQLHQAQQIIAGLVQAADQIGIWDAALDEGKKRKQWVLEQAEAQLAQHGIALDLDRLDVMVEAAVWEANAPKRQPQQPRVIGAG